MKPVCHEAITILGEETTVLVKIKNSLLEYSSKVQYRNTNTKVMSVNFI